MTHSKKERSVYTLKSVHLSFLILEKLKEERLSELYYIMAYYTSHLWLTIKHLAFSVSETVQK